MRRTQILFLVAFAVALCAAAGSQAAVISVQPVIAGFLNPDFSPSSFVPVPLPGGGTTNAGGPTVVQIDVYIEVLSLAPGEDSFGTAAFSFEMGPTIPGTTTIVPDADAGGWAAYQFVIVDINGNGPGGFVPPLAIDADLGADSQDYIGILIQMATGAFTNPLDQRRNFAEPGGHWGAPVNVGSAFFEWDGLGEVEITLTPIEVSAKLTNGAFVLGQAPPSAILRLGNNLVPEPSSLMLIAVGAFGVSARRR
jgi:hypothetical protein